MRPGQDCELSDAITSLRNCFYIVLRNWVTVVHIKNLWIELNLFLEQFVDTFFFKSYQLKG